MRVYLNLKGPPPSSNGNGNQTAVHRRGRKNFLLVQLDFSRYREFENKLDRKRRNERIINIIINAHIVSIPRLCSDKKLAPISHPIYRPPSETLINETLRTNPIYVSLVRISPVNEVNSLHRSLVARKLGHPCQTIPFRDRTKELSLSLSLSFSRIAKYIRLSNGPFSCDSEENREARYGGVRNKTWTFPKSGGEIELEEGETSRGRRDEDNRRGRTACGEWIREEKYRLDPVS